MITARDRAIGATCGISAYLCWGFVALYFQLIINRGVAADDLLANRVVWSLLFCLVIVLLRNGGKELRAVVCDRKRLMALSLSSVLVGTNWMAFILAVKWNRLIEASLGYYILPLVSVVLGLTVLRERLSRVEWLSVGLAVVGVGIIIASNGGVPWLALTVAFSFAFYGLVRKLTQVGPLLGMTIETAVLAPFALAYIFWHASVAGTYDPITWLLLAIAGAITSVLLMLYARAAQSLRLSTLGFLQYFSPTVQLIVAIKLFHEPTSLRELAGFVPIWLGLLIYSIHTAIRSRQNSGSGKVPAPRADSSTVRAGHS